MNIAPSIASNITVLSLWSSLSLMPFILLFAAPVLYAFEDQTLAIEAAQYHQLIRDSYSATAKASLEKAENFTKQGDWYNAISEYEKLIASTGNTTANWLRLSTAWVNYQADWERSRNRSVQAAYRGYQVAKNNAEKARALFHLGQLYVDRYEQKSAMAVFKAGLALENNPAIAKQYQQLVESNAFRVTGIEADSNGPTPRICLEFSDTLSKNKQIYYEDYVQIKPAVKIAARLSDRQLCLEGIEFSQRYEVTVRSGVPAQTGEKLATAQTFTVEVKNRPPRVAFRGTAYVMPRLSQQFLPLNSVNLDRARLTLLRIHDRNLLAQINEKRITKDLAGYNIEEIIERSGEQLWQGEITLLNELNKDMTTAIPISEILQNTSPGIYVMVAEPIIPQLESYEDRATQWLVVSDLGLSTFKGSDGLHVFVYSLETAKPLANVELRLYARNNVELGTVTTNQRGYGRFDPGLLRGQGGRTVGALMAYGPQQDFNFLDLTRPAFDLSDRGVEGRKAPGPIDVFLYSERGVYRPGETVELMALARNNRGEALDQLPLTLKLIRPDGVEANTLSLMPTALGGYHRAIPMANTARTGQWHIKAYADPTANPVGELAFLVEDFVPQRLKVALATDAKLLLPNKAITLAVDGRFLYGAPAAHLRIQGEVLLEADTKPYPDYPQYRFGHIQETWTATRKPLDLVSTDAQGKAQTQVRLDDIPDVNKPLKAVMRVSLFEPGGRPVNQVLELPYRVQPLAIGIRPHHTEGAVPLGSETGFDVIALNAEGLPQAATLRYDVYREEYEYYWHYREYQWNYTRILRDSRPLVSQTLTVTADKPAVIKQRGLEWGSYRLEVTDPKTAVVSSIRFAVGWATAESDESPDQLRITLEKPRYRIGDIAKVHVRAPFAGEALLTIVSDVLYDSRIFSIPEQGTTIDLPIDERWGTGVYLTATAFRPAKNPQQRGPGRAIGVTWLALDPQPRQLMIQLDVPDELTPQQTFNLPVTVTGVQRGKPAYVTVAAVDEGILQLTQFVSPNPVDYFFGKRKLGVELLDLYGKLIEVGGQPGKLRVGGDSFGRHLDGSGVQTVKTVALFSGLVTLDEAGKAQIPLTLPDFNGELRLMAVAWDQEKLGHADKPLLVRDPLVTQLYLPRFLAPQDRSHITLTVQNLRAAAGEYRVNVTSSGAMNLENPSEQVFTITDPAQQNRAQYRYTVQGQTPGIGQITLTVTGPNGFALTRHWDIGVRAAQTVVTQRIAESFAANETRSFTADDLKDYLPGSNRLLTVTVASRPALDVPGLLAQLDRYPYGCIEQTTSRALPLLYFGDVAKAWGVETGTDDPQQRLQPAINRLIAQQRFDGSFGLWSPDNDAEAWLSAYVMEFLTRARAQNYFVPTDAYQRGLNYLKDQLLNTETTPERLVARAYILYVLAMNEIAPLSELRYLHDTQLDQLPTALSRAQLAASLARYGELKRAEEAFQTALQAVQKPLDERTQWREYGSVLRDRAALVALLSESGLMKNTLATLADELATDVAQRPYTSTQEQAWLLIAAHALTAQAGSLTVQKNGQSVTEDPFYLRFTSEADTGVTLVNQGAAAWITRTLSGVPVKTQPAVQRGFSILRQFYTRTGQIINPPVKVKQNDLMVVVITGEVLTPEPHQALIVDLLPAGVEIENARLGYGESADQVRWLTDVTTPVHTELRDDRFVTALDLAADKRTFTVAYLVRAVTPGEYQLPAVFIEDMYKPAYHARGALSTFTVE